jgi:hypothetical protein
MAKFARFKDGLGPQETDDVSAAVLGELDEDDDDESEDDTGELLQTPGQEALIPRAELRPGNYVKVTGLMKFPDLNGQRGVCQHWRADEQLWDIKLESGAELNVKPENLETVEASAPSVEGTSTCTGGGRSDSESSGSAGEESGEDGAERVGKALCQVTLGDADLDASSAGCSRMQRRLSARRKIVDSQAV